MKTTVAFALFGCPCMTMLMFCGDSHCDCGGDAGNPCNGPQPVSHGASCTSDDAGACGYATSCGHVLSFKTVTLCACANGRWNCDTEACPQCADPTIVGSTCASSPNWCGGPTHAQTCDGVVHESDGGCECTSSGWRCDEVATVVCADASVDDAADAD